MKFAAIFISLFSFLAQDIPYKANEEFELILDFQFRQRPKSDAIKLTHTPSASSPLPFLKARLNVLKIQEDEYRVRVINTQGDLVATKILSKSASLDFDLGYTDDLKDHAAKFIVQFTGKGKSVERKIVVGFQKDGSYYVNGDLRGKI